MCDLISLYKECIQRLEERRDELLSSRHFTISKDDVYIRCKILDEEIEDMYFALNLMKASREA